MNVLQGKTPKTGTKIAIVISRFNEMITGKLLESATETLTRQGIAEQDITVAWVPGSLEIPLVAKQLANTEQFDGILCLGAVIKGETYHFEIVSDQSAQAILKVSLEANLPIINGILCSYSVEQALVRAEKNGKNKGAEFAQTLLELVDLLTSRP